MKLRDGTMSYAMSETYGENGVQVHDVRTICEQFWSFERGGSTYKRFGRTYTAAFYLWELFLALKSILLMIDGVACVRNG